MSSLQTIDFKLDHLLGEVEFPRMPYSVQECASMFKSDRVVAFSIFYKEKLLAVVANLFIKKTVVETMLYVTQHASRYPRSLLIACSSLLNNAGEILGIHRAQATVAVSNDAALKMDLMLGFEYEALLEKYDESGEDCYLLKRIYV